MQSRFSKYKKNIIEAAIILFPLLIGLVGFLRLGYSFEESLYDSFGLYFVNRDEGTHLNWLITIAEFTAPIFLFSGFLIVIGGFARRIKGFFLSMFYKNVVAVYGDNDKAAEIAKNTLHGIYMEKKILAAADKHLIMFSHELDSIDFFKKHADVIKTDKTYIVLKDLDTFLIKGNGNEGKGLLAPMYVNINEIIARNFWLEHNLLEKISNRSDIFNIAIVGFDSLGEKLLYYGLQYNLYNPNQNIVYHVWGDSDLFENAHAHLNEQIKDGNIRDEVIFYGSSYSTKPELLRKMNLVILTKPDDITYAEFIINMCDSKTEIFWNNDENADFSEIIDCDNLTSFGLCKAALSMENIERESISENARALCNEYNNLYKSGTWQESTGFQRESNITATDYHYIRELILNNSADSEIDNKYIKNLCLLEHVRWCRFYALNFWHEGTPNNGEKKDPTTKTHYDLAHFDTLPFEEQTKDVEIISILLRIYSGERKITQSRRNELLLKLSLYKYEPIAISYWINNSLVDLYDAQLQTASAKIAIINFDLKGLALLYQAVNVNIFSLNQEIIYYIWGNRELYESIGPLINSICVDSVIYMGEEYNGQDGDYDRIINTDGVDYSKDIYDDIVLKAMKLSGKSWEKASEFIRELNIEAVCYSFVREGIISAYDDTIQNSQEFENGLAVLEHERWCRFYHLNGWKYKNVKNSVNKESPLIVSFDELDEEEKEKDLKIIRKLRNRS